MTIHTLYLPDTGSANALEVIEILVKPGDAIAENQALLTLESDKATLDVPALLAGTLVALKVKVGDKIKTGDPIAELDSDAATTEQPSTTSTANDKKTKSDTPTTKLDDAATEIKKPSETPVAPVVTAPISIPVAASTPNSPISNSTASDSNTEVYAGPGVRRMARLLGVDLTRIQGSGDKGRINKNDIQVHIKTLIDQAQNGTSANKGFNLPHMPEVDFSLFGTVETQPLSRIKKLTAQNLSRNWLLAPHVTQFETSDITEMEAFRKSQAPIYDKQGLKLTPLIFIMKAVVHALQSAPTFNASLDASGENLILKKYFHIGIAVDTPNGLVVPVIRNVDQKSLTTLARELAEVSLKARAQKLSTQDMQGSSFTISSLGGIGGTAFTPIINLPNVAILGVSKATIQPQWNGKEFQPRLMLPLSLSYDHRVIDGAEAARFTITIAQALQDIRRLLL